MALSEAIRKLSEKLFASIQFKIIVSTIAVVAIAVGLSTWFAVGSLEHQLLENTKHKLKTACEKISKNISMAMQNGHIPSIHRSFSLIRSYPHYEVQMFIADSLGTILVGTDSTKVGKKLKLEKGGINKSDVIIFKEHIQKSDILVAQQSILNKPACYKCHDPGTRINGILQVRVALSEFMRDFSLFRELMIGNGIVIFLVMTITLSLLLGLIVSRPLKEMSRAMQKIETGDLNVRVKFNRRDEIGHLGKSFNAMVQRLADSIRQLTVSHENELQHADRLAALGELAAGIAHEIRNPLAGISGAVQVLASELDKNDPHYDVMNEIQKEIKRLDNSLENFLTYARPSEPKFQPFDIHDVIERALMLCLRSGQFSGITLVRDFRITSKQLIFDPALMQQVFMNIILNSLQAMNHSGRLTITTRIREDSPHSKKVIEIVFADTGPGIPPENLKKVFQPFFTSKHQGTGLGLAIARRIVEQHGGSISVISSPGQGTQFTIILPYSEMSSVS
ncbi:MAG: HAMP domain-containing protein [Calditrichaeota bacterium]|nr:HAMP domain-containing protein [Calditrichota bacterium]